MLALPQPVIAGMQTIVYSVQEAEGFERSELPQLLEPKHHAGMWHEAVRSRLYEGLCWGNQRGGTRL